MLIEAGQVKHLLPETAMSGDDVGDDFLVGVTEVRFAVDVIDGGGQVNRLLIRAQYAPLAKRLAITVR